MPVGGFLKQAIIHNQSVKIRPLTVKSCLTPIFSRLLRTILLYSPSRATSSGLPDFGLALVSGSLTQDVVISVGGQFCCLFSRQRFPLACGLQLLVRS